MPQKLFRDPLYNYIGIERGGDDWLPTLLDCVEVQRLRRVHQLGVSDFTYPGATHTRFAHTLGVMHLMRQMVDRAERLDILQGAAERARGELLAAAVLHDVGHGPFSHLAENFLEGDHEEWSARTVLDPATEVNAALKRAGIDPPQVARLIHDDGVAVPRWKKSLLSSQLDVDRMDYLRRDSLATGAGYGTFDWFRLVNTFEVEAFAAEAGEEDLDGRGLVWPEKAAFAIEEFIFARLYMYQNVYNHKTTRGFERVLARMWGRARELATGGDSTVFGVAALRVFQEAGGGATVGQYLAVEEHAILSQVQLWREHPDDELSDLARRYLGRRRLSCVVEPPVGGDVFTDVDEVHRERERSLREAVEDRCGGRGFPHCLLDTVKSAYSRPYSPTIGEGKSSANLIHVRARGGVTEVSRALPRLGGAVADVEPIRRWYVPEEAAEAARELAFGWILTP